MKWLFCFKYAKTDSFVDKTEKPGDKTSEHLYPHPRLKLCYRVLKMYKMYENPEKNHEKSPLSVDL